jgi:peroxiredoxin (alkyl hydroperoxide reductase subunit C)
VLGVSTDTHYVHLAWRIHEPSLKDLPFPMLADTKRELATALGVIHPAEGVAVRATFIVDPEGVIRHVTVIDALQTGGLTPCNWKAGDPTLRVA